LGNVALAAGFLILILNASTPSAPIFAVLFVIVGIGLRIEAAIRDSAR
jgi:hypothetical protein